MEEGTRRQPASLMPTAGWSHLPLRPLKTLSKGLKTRASLPRTWWPYLVFAISLSLFHHVQQLWGSFFFSCLYMQMYNEIITTHIIWLMPPNFVWWISMWHLNNWMQRFRSFFLAIGRHFHYKTKKNKWMPFFQFQPILSERITGVLTFLFIDFFTIMYVIFWIRLISYIWKEI